MMQCSELKKRQKEEFLRTCINNKSFLTLEG